MPFLLLEHGLKFKPVPTVSAVVVLRGHLNIRDLLHQVLDLAANSDVVSYLTGLGSSVTLVRKAISAKLKSG
jgi:hypothetical protein